MAFKLNVRSVVLSCTWAFVVQGSLRPQKLRYGEEILPLLLTSLLSTAVH